MGMSISGFSAADKRTPTRKCRDCYDGAVQAVSFSPDALPVRRCIPCWRTYYLQKREAEEAAREQTRA